ncbi:MAG: hypothetical protein HKL86_03405 [Acidimicrobiaceae bacterium]|nr:hypothetical protein [Acidimicrobiaceae bacterium]
MGVLKTVFRVAALVILAATIMVLMKVLKKSKSSGPISFERWPDVARNPAS